MNRTPGVLIVGSSESNAARISGELLQTHYPLMSERAKGSDGVRKALETREWDAIILDAAMLDPERRRVINMLQERNAQVPCVVVYGGRPSSVKPENDELSDRAIHVSFDTLGAAVIDLLKEGTAHRRRQETQLTLSARARQQEVVAELGLRALAGADPYALIDEVVESVAQTLTMDLCGVFELTAEGGALLPHLGDGWECEPVGAPPRLPREGGSQIDCTLTSDETIIVEDYSNNSRFQAPAASLCRDVLSGVTVAMRSRDRSYGVLAACARQPRSFSPDDIHFLESVANVLAAALERRVAEGALRESEERMRQSQKLEAIGLLAGGIAHDFNNLLTAVVGFSELLLVDLDSEDPRRQYAEEIKKAGERAAGLTTQLLAFDRRQVLQPRVLDLNDIVTSMEQLLRRAVTDRVQLVAVQPQGLGRVLADPHQIEQVLLNLAVNARDAMPQGGSLTIQTANVELTPALAPPGVAPGSYVRLAVSDTGTGMDDATRAHIFEPFFTTKEPGRGTGLGLATVYGIVKQSGGDIDVASELGQGTTFSIYLPAVEKGEDALTPEIPVVSSDGGRETILLVEDEDGVRALARTVLQSGGYTVLEASRGDDALEIVKSHDGFIDLLVTDLVMPGMGGRELSERVLALGGKTRVLYMSGYTNDRLLDVGTAYLQKPISPRTLAQKVREVLESANPEVLV